MKFLEGWVCPRDIIDQLLMAIRIRIWIQNCLFSSEADRPKSLSKIFLVEFEMKISHESPHAENYFVRAVLVYSPQ